MQRFSRLHIISLMLMLMLFFNGCYVNEQGALVIGTPTPEGETAGQVAEEVAEPVEPTPAMTEETPEPVILTGTVNTRSLRVRQGPNTETPIVAGLSQSDEITVIGRNADGAWLQIQVPDVETTGWVSAEFVDLEADAAGLPIADGSADTPTATEPASDAVATAEPAEAPTATPIAAQVTPQIDLVDTAAAISEFSTLVTTIEAAGLAEILEIGGPFTVFAPTDDAFAALPDGVLDALLADPDDLLNQILLYHVVPDEVLAAEIAEGLTLATAQGESLTFSVADGALMVNDAAITLTDIEASNGVIHVIDTVLVPESVDVTAIVSAAPDTPTAEAEATPAVTVTATLTETEATPAVTVTATLTATTVVTATDIAATATPTATLAPEAGEAAGAIILPATDRLAQVNTRSLRVRQTADLESDVVWGVRNGEFYAVVDQTEDEMWTALAIPELNGIGWVSTEFLIITQEMPVIPTLGSVTVATTDGSRLRVRDIPSEEGQLLSNLNAGEIHEVVATTEDGAWALINIAGTPGPSWVATEFVEMGAPVQQPLP